MRPSKKGIFTRNYQLGRRKNYFTKFSNAKVRYENGARRRMPVSSRGSKPQQNYTTFKRKIPSLLANMVFDERDQNLGNFSWKKARRQPLHRDNYKEHSLSRSFQDNMKKKEDIEVCRKWLKFGECMYGEHCKYRHYSRHSDSEKFDYSGEPSTSRLSYDSERASIRSHKFGSSNKYLDVPTNFSHERNSSGSSNHNIHMRDSPLIAHTSYHSPKIGISKKSHEIAMNKKDTNKYISPTLQKTLRSPSLVYTSDSEKSKKGSVEKRFKPSSVVVVVNHKKTTTTSSKRHEARLHGRPIKNKDNLIDQQNKIKSGIVPSIVVNIHGKSTSREGKRISTSNSPSKKATDKKEVLKSNSVARSSNIPTQKLKQSVKPSAIKTRNRLVSSIRTLARQNNFKKKIPPGPGKQSNTVVNRIKGRTNVSKQAPSIFNGKTGIKRGTALSTVGDVEKSRSIITRCVLLPSKKKMQEAALHKNTKPESVHSSEPNKTVKSPQKKVDRINPQHKMSKNCRIPTPPSTDKAQDKKSIVKSANDNEQKYKSNSLTSDNENKLISKINSKADDKLTSHPPSRPKDEEEIAVSLEDLELKRQLLLFELQKEQLEDQSSSSPLNPILENTISVDISKSPVKDNTRFIPVTREKIYLMQNLPEKKLSPVSKPRTFVPRSVVKPSINQPKKGKIIKKIETTRLVAEPQQQILPLPQTVKSSIATVEAALEPSMPANIKQVATLDSQEFSIKHEIPKSQNDPLMSANLTPDTQEMICAKTTKQLSKTNARSIAEAYFNELTEEEEEGKDYIEPCESYKSQKEGGPATKVIKPRSKQLRKNKGFEHEKRSLQTAEEKDSMPNIKEIDMEEGEWHSSSSIYSDVGNSPNSEIPDISSQSSSASSLKGSERGKGDIELKDASVSPLKSPLTSSQYVVPRVVATRPNKNIRDLEGECKLGGARPLDSDEDLDDIGFKTEPGTKKMPVTTTIHRSEINEFDILQASTLDEIAIMPTVSSPLNRLENELKGAAGKTKSRSSVDASSGEAKVDDYENISSEESSCLDAELETVSQELAPSNSKESTQKSVSNESREKLISFLREFGISRDLVSAKTYETIVKATGRPFKHDIAALHMKMVEKEREELSNSKDGLEEALKLLNPEHQILTGKLDKALRDILMGSNKSSIQPVAEMQMTTPTRGIPKEFIPSFLSSCSSKDNSAERALVLFNRSLERFNARFNKNLKIPQLIVPES